MMQMLKRGWTAWGRWLGPAVLGLGLVGAVLACSGPPPPTVTILPTKVEYSYTDIDGQLQGPMVQDLIDFDNPRDTGGGDKEYYYCGDAAATDSMCFHYPSRMAMVEVPAGAKVTFGAFQYNPPSSNPGGGLVNPHLDTVDAMIASIAGSSASMKINEMQTRGSGGAFDMTPPAGAVPGIKAAMILDWAGINPDSPDYYPPDPGSYILDLNASPSLNQPNPSAANLPADFATDFPDYNLNFSGSFPAAEQKWYAPTGLYDGQATDVVRIVEKHMNSKGLGEVWIWLENETSTHDIDGDGNMNEIGRLHVWAAVGGYMQTNGGRMGLYPGKDPTSDWVFDIPPDSATGFTPRAPFQHVSLNDRGGEGIAYPNISGASGGERFEYEQTYPLATEPTGYMVRSDVNIYWGYGTYAPGGGGDWFWTIGRRYMGFVDFTGMNIEKDGAVGVEVIRRVEIVKSQLRCLPTDVASGPPHYCTYETDPAISDDSLTDDMVDLVDGGGPIPMSAFSDFFPASAPSTASATSYLHPVPDLTSLTISSPLPTGFSTATYRYSGVFPQTTRGNGGKPGYAFIVARDIQAPRYANIVSDGTGPDISGGTLGDSSDPIAETGRLVIDSLDGAGSTFDVVVWDDNPGNVAYASRNGAGVFREGSSTDISGSLSGLDAVINRDSDGDGTPDGRSPMIQVWYTAQKAGYDYRRGNHIDIGSTALPQTAVDLLVEKRGSMLGADNQLIPSPTFRFYAFRDASGEVQNYLPYRYDVLENGGEAIGVVMRYSVDLADMREPMGIHYAKGSLDHSAGGVDYPAYDPKMMKLFVRATDGRLSFPSGSTLIQTPTDAPWADYASGNYAPYFDDQTSEHESGFLNATRKFPGGDETDVPVDLNSEDPLIPPPIQPASEATAIRNAARDFTDHLGNQPFTTLANSSTERFSKAIGIPVKDVVPPTVVLMIRDTKYDQTVFFGNTLLGDMSSAELQQSMRDAFAADDPGTDADDRAEVVDPETSYAGDVVGGVGTKLFPYFNVAGGMANCSDPYDPADAPCLVQPSGLGDEWVFEYGAGRTGGSDINDYTAQLTMMENLAFHPTSFWAAPSVLPDDCATSPTSTQCRLTQPRGMWVDEDTRLILRVLAWDNLNAYKTDDPHTYAEGLGGERFENIEISGQEDPPEIGDGEGRIDVRIVDAPSGYDDDPASELNLSGSSEEELRESWPTYTFRNPNRRGASGDEYPTKEDAFIEVKYTDPAGNATILKVNMFVMENNMTIRSLQEDRLRSMGGE